MINHEDNPEYLNSFLDYTMTILNKSPNTVKEYNYDLATFLKFIKIRFNLTQEDDFSLYVTKGYGTWGFPIRTTGNSEILQIVYLYS